ncbi:MAG: hypothetical protein Q4P32_12860, partial [Micrococcales bacterium]|nr:hypothetical protein [Micrococcales bacterium]
MAEPRCRGRPPGLPRARSPARATPRRVIQEGVGRRCVGFPDMLAVRLWRGLLRLGQGGPERGR